MTLYRDGDVHQVLLRLGIDTAHRGKENVGLCPMHLERTGKQDHNPSWSVNSYTGVHHCFSCGYKGTLLTLVAEVLEFKTEWDRLDLEAAKQWLQSNVEVDLDLLVAELEKMRETYITLPKPVEMSEARLALFTTPPQWALDARGLRESDSNRCGILWDPKQENWISTIRNAHSYTLMGWQEKGQKTRYFRNRPTGVAKSSTLFAIDKWDGITMIVVESPLDVPKLMQSPDVENMQFGVATYGAAVSEAQFSLFRAAERLIFAFDNARLDAAGEKAAKDLLARTKKEGMECSFFNYGDSGAKDIGDMSADQISWGLRNAKHCVYGERAIYGG